MDGTIKGRLVFCEYPTHNERHPYYFLETIRIREKRKMVDFDRIWESLEELGDTGCWVPKDGATVGNAFGCVVRVQIARQCGYKVSHRTRKTRTCSNLRCFNPAHIFGGWNGNNIS